MVLVVREQDHLEAAEQQISSALLCGCPVIVAADSAHQTALKGLQTQYQQAGLAKALLQLTHMESLSELIQNNSIEGLIANSSNTDSTDLRQVMAKRTGSIIPLIEWPETAEGFTYHWLLWFLSERTRTENLVARGGNTQLFNLAE
jgi:RHH-type proline utilization regulon transcriptional repressor/proline dehydrogenase/delta 1-pyrroline-5-carboxylate dehydrogenase